MARILIEGFEIGTLDTESNTPSNYQANGTLPSINNTDARTGSYCLRVAPSSGGSAAWTTGSLVAGNWVSFSVKFAALPPSDKVFFGSSAAGYARLVVTSAGAIKLLDGNGATKATSANGLLSEGVYVRVEMRIVFVDRLADVYVDGVAIFTAVSLVDGVTSGDVPLFFGSTPAAESGTYIAYYDDIIVDDADRPGDCRVVLLKPIADVQRGSWTGGALGTTNLWDAIDNIPPIGTATETNFTQIESSDSTGANSSDEYKVSFASYATAGVTVGSTINAVQLINSNGEDVATGTKTGIMELRSNPGAGAGAPASSNSFVFGNNYGALGTWPALWSRALGSVVANPTVVLGTSPQAALLKTDSGTRVASICFMGLVVDWSPAVIVVFDPPHPRIISQAIQRAAVR